MATLTTLESKLAEDDAKITFQFPSRGTMQLAAAATIDARSIHARVQS